MTNADRLITRGVSVRALRGGSGAPIVYIHGAGGLPPWWPFFERLARHYQLLVPEHPCFGASDDPPWMRTVADLAMYYLDVLDATYDAPVHVIGHSLGGWIAAEAAVRNTHRFASLTLIAPAGIRVKGAPTGDVFIWSPEELVRNRFHDQRFAEALLQAPPPSEDETDAALQTALAAVKFGWEPRWFNPDLDKWLHRISVPTRIFWGKQDKILPSVYAQRWKQKIAHADITLIDACGHLPQVEKSDLVADAILAALDRVPR